MKWAVREVINGTIFNRMDGRYLEIPLPGAQKHLPAVPIATPS